MSYIQDLFDSQSQEYMDMYRRRVEILVGSVNANDEKLLDLCQLVEERCIEMLDHSDEDLKTLRFIHGRGEPPEYIRTVLNAHMAEARTYMESVKLNRAPLSMEETQSLAKRLGITIDE